MFILPLYTFFLSLFAGSRKGCEGRLFLSLVHTINTTCWLYDYAWSQSQLRSYLWSNVWFDSIVIHMCSKRKEQQDCLARLRCLLFGERSKLSSFHYSSFDRYKVSLWTHTLRNIPLVIGFSIEATVDSPSPDSLLFYLEIRLSPFDIQSLSFFCVFSPTLLLSILQVWARVEDIADSAACYNGLTVKTLRAVNWALVTHRPIEEETCSRA